MNQVIIKLIKFMFPMMESIIENPDALALRVVEVIDDGRYYCKYQIQVLDGGKYYEEHRCTLTRQD